MPKVLTTASTVKCFHGQAITFTSTATLRVGGAPVVRQSDLAAATFACTAPVQAPRCASISVSQTTTVLRDGSNPVVLASGLSTNGGVCTVEIEHDILKE